MMTDKELSRLKRGELLEMLLEQSKEVEKLKKSLAQAQEQLKERAICIEEVGSIAEASLQLNGVFTAAQEASEQYLDNIKMIEKKKETEMKDVKIQAKQLLENTKVECLQLKNQMEAQCQQKEIETEQKCAAMIAKAKRDSEEKWDKISRYLEEFYDAHKGLRELITFTGDIQRD